MTPPKVKSFCKFRAPHHPMTILEDAIILGTNRSCVPSPCALPQLTLPYLIIYIHIHAGGGGGGAASVGGGGATSEGGGGGAPVGGCGSPDG